jgi:hypothetical protein
MSDSRLSTRATGGTQTRFFYWGALAMLTLTGFAQMPIFKRYYIADIPGLGWLSQFYVTHYLHYLFAVVLLGLAAYATVDYLLAKRKFFKISTTGVVKVGILAGLVITGLLLAVRNLPGPRFTPGLIVFLDLAHMALVVVFIGTAAYGVLTKTPWLFPRKAQERIDQ